MGGEQHGNMEAVGYDMYLKMLADAVNEQNGVEVQEDVNCTVDLNVSAHIPEGYIPALPARLGIYRRIADIRDEGDMTDVIDELCDRFGEPPKAVMGLINIALVRSKASCVGITEIVGTQGTVILRAAKIDMEIVGKLTNEFNSAFRVSAVGDPAYVVKLLNGLKTADVIARLAKIL